MWYIIIIMAIGVIGYLVKSYRKINSLSEKGTILVAFTKDAMSQNFLSKEIPAKEQYEKLMLACYLFNCFLVKTNKVRGNYNFYIMENGPIYGKVVDVQLSSFVHTVKTALMETASSFPTEYCGKIEHYMNAPFSEEGRKLSENAILWFSLDKYGSSLLKNIHERCMESMKNMDFMFTLFK